MKSNLLASSSTLESIAKAASDFYCGTKVTLIADGESRWKISRDSDGKLLPGVAVFLKRGRYRFEMVPA